MKIRKAVFIWKRIEKDPIDFQNMNRMEIVFEEGLDKPIILIDAGGVKIEDRTFEIDNREVLKKIGEVDFDLMYDSKYQSDYSGNIWELVINEKKYEGIFEDPHYVIKIKRIIRFNAIQVYANKKLAGYLKS